MLRSEKKLNSMYILRLFENNNCVLFKDFRFTSIVFVK